MAMINWVIQSKGGVGKSVIASLQYQFFLWLGLPVFGYDVDAENNSLYDHKEFREENGGTIKKIELFREGDTQIDAGLFDVLLNDLMALPEEAYAVVDTGTSSYVALAGYIKEIQALDMLRDAGHTVYIHCPIAGGGSLKETIESMASLLYNFPNIKIIPWLNRHIDGSIELDGRPFQRMDIYQDNRERFHAIVELPYKNHQTFGKDLAAMFAKRHSFQASITSASLPIITRQRLKIFWQDAIEVMQQANLLAGPGPAPAKIEAPEADAAFEEAEPVEEKPTPKKKGSGQ